MKIYSITEVEKTNVKARRDLAAYKSMLDNLKQQKLLKIDFEVLQGAWPVTPEQLGSNAHWTIWKLKVQDEIIRIEKLLEGNERWLTYRRNTPHRCALPKKKQRELGMLPPV